MAITGNLKSFYLSSLLQLLSNDKKTGILELTDGSDIVQVLFQEGTIINAFGSSRVERLTNYLRSEGIVSAEQLEKCLSMSAHTGKKIGKVLVEQGLISQELLESLLHRQIEQTLFSLFLWKQGEFEYRDQELDLSDQIITSFDTMQIVLEASRRVDEITQLKQRVPQDNDVLAINANSETLQKASLNTAERAVLSLINGRRTVKKIINDSGYDELKVYKTLFSLVTSGLVIREKNILKRSADTVKKEISDLQGAVAASSNGQAGKPHASQDSAQAAEGLFASPNSPEPAQEDANTAVAPASSPEFARGVEGLFAEPSQPDSTQTAEPVPTTIQQDLPPEPQETTLKIETQLQDDGHPGESEPATGSEETLDADVNIAGATVIKVDGRFLTEVDLPDIEPPKRPQIEPVDKNELAEALRVFGGDGELAEDEQAYVRARRKRLLITAACAAAVIVIAVAALLLKPVLFPGEPEPAPVPLKTKPAQVAQEKEAAPERQEETAPAQKEAADAIEPEQPGVSYDFFQDEKGWVSINLPPGYSISEQPLQDRAAVTISYDNDIRLVLTVVPDTGTWSAEDEMYAAIVRMQDSGGLSVQKYAALKHAGCPGYMIQYTSQRDQKTVQTAMYRFVCYNKSARLEVVSLSWRTAAGRELGQKIYEAIEASFLIYP